MMNLKNGIRLLLLGVLLFLVFNRHSKSPLFSYQSEIHADKAGYYIYLPALISSGMDVNQLPQGIDTLTGDGFRINYENETFETKYTSGVAIMQSPFYLMAHLIAHIAGEDSSGFTSIYYAFVNIASVFYLWLGLLILYEVMIRFFNKWMVVIGLFCLLTGTNLFYYGIDETGMSHVYSFFLFSCLIYLFYSIDKFKEQPLRLWILVGFIIGFIALIRPTNIIYPIFLFLINYKTFLSKKWLMQLKMILPGVLAAFLVWIPQILYWKWAYGSWFTYSYGNEYFSNWSSPELIKTLFAPNNGWVSNSPIVIFFIAGSLWLVIKKKREGILSLGLTILTIYMTSSWWVYTFGCGYGARNFVEFYVVMLFPFLFLIKKVSETPLRYPMLVVLLMLCVFNLKVIYAYDECWFGANDWDWNYYFSKIDWFR